MVPPKTGVQLAQPVSSGGAAHPDRVPHLRGRLLPDQGHRPPAPLVGRAGRRHYGHAECSVHGKITILLSDIAQCFLTCGPWGKPCKMTIFLPWGQMLENTVKAAHPFPSYNILNSPSKIC